MKVQIIQDRIYEVRGEKIMFDFDLAELYGVETRVFNQAVKRNAASFPKDFMFRITKKEWKDMMSQIMISSENGKPIDTQRISSQERKRPPSY
ncbi:MAG: ORF6N domain-containing protein [Chitinophagaceae bacterium]|nr:ORF6N domain-containing protein [Chitinophagaceae bacterium]